MPPYIGGLNQIRGSRAEIRPESADNAEWYWLINQISGYKAEFMDSSAQY